MTHVLNLTDKICFRLNWTKMCDSCNEILVNRDNGWF